MIFTLREQYPGHWHPWSTRCGAVQPGGATYCNLISDHEGEHAHLTGPKYGECEAIWDNEREWGGLTVGPDSGR